MSEFSRIADRARRLIRDAARRLERELREERALKRETSMTREQAIADAVRAIRAAFPDRAEEIITKLDLVERPRPRLRPFTVSFEPGIFYDLHVERAALSPHASRIIFVMEGLVPGARPGEVIGWRTIVSDVKLPAGGPGTSVHLLDPTASAYFTTRGVFFERFHSSRAGASFDGDAFEEPGIVVSLSSAGVERGRWSLVEFTRAPGDSAELARRIADDVRAIRECDQGDDD